MVQLQARIAPDAHRGAATCACACTCHVHVHVELCRPHVARGWSHWSYKECAGSRYSTVRVGQDPLALGPCRVAGSCPEKQPFSWRRLPFGDAFQSAARAGGQAGASEHRK
eukprot:5371208-Prymnesium_polylepis.1